MVGSSQTDLPSVTDPRTWESTHCILSPIRPHGLGGAIIICVMLCLGELAVANPVSSSFVTYARQFISPAWACGVGWSYLVTWVTYVPAEMIAAGIIMESFVPGVGKVWWSLLFKLLITAINLLYVKAFGEVEFWLSLIKIAAILMFVSLALAIALGLVGEDPPVGTSKPNFLLATGASE